MKLSLGVRKLRPVSQVPVAYRDAWGAFTYFVGFFLVNTMEQQWLKMIKDIVKRVEKVTVYGRGARS